MVASREVYGVEWVGGPAGLQVEAFVRLALGIRNFNAPECPEKYFDGCAKWNSRDTASHLIFAWSAGQDEESRTHGLGRASLTLPCRLTNAIPRRIGFQILSACLCWHSVKTFNTSKRAGPETPPITRTGSARPPFERLGRPTAPVFTHNANRFCEVHDQ